MGDVWLHEIMFDGYRLQVHVRSGSPRIFTRKVHDWTAKFPDLARDVSSLPDFILDGELCALDESGYSTLADSPRLRWLDHFEQGGPAFSTPPGGGRLQTQGRSISQRSRTYPNGADLRRRVT